MAGEYFNGVTDWKVDGKRVACRFILCGAGDWPELKAELDTPNAWSTMRCGVLVLAVEVPCSDLIPDLPAIPKGKPQPARDSRPGFRPSYAQADVFSTN